MMKKRQNVRLGKRNVEGKKNKNQQLNDIGHGKFPLSLCPNPTLTLT
jgi:hypothetical protein